MARGSRLYQGRVELADTDRGYYQRLEPATALHPSESVDRLVLRLLAYLVLHEPGLTFRGGGVSQGEEPDLAVRDDSGAISHWIDVGTPAAERLRKAARRGRRLTVVTHEELLHRWKRQHGESLPAFDGSILVLQSALVNSLAEELPRRIRWQATISGATLFLEHEGRSLSSTLELLDASR